MVMKKITLSLLIWFISYCSFSQCPPNGTERTSVDSANDGSVQPISSNFYTDEYVTITMILNTDTYQFISTHGDPAVNDYITVTDVSNVPIGWGMSPLTLYNINQATIRVHIRANMACDTDISAHILTLQDLPTCYEPQSPGISYKSNTRIDFYWSAPSMSAPVDYDWEIVPFGNAQGVGVIVSGSTGGDTSASSGETLTTNMSYSIFIRSDCGAGDNSIYLGPLNFTTLADPPPSNDKCNGAISILEQTNVLDAASAIPTAGDLLGGAGTDVSLTPCGGNALDDVWYKFVAKTTDVNITVEPNSNVNFIVSLFSGSCGALNFLNCKNDYGSNPPDEQISQSGLTIGQTYYVRTYYFNNTTNVDRTFNIKIWSTTAATDVDNDGYVASVDCNDNNSSIYPGAPEVTANGIDENCDGMFTWYQDNDGDSYGSTTIIQSANSSPGAGESANSNDCDDGNSAINPDTVWYLDADGDNYAVSTMTQCTSPGAGYTASVLPITDCDDSDSAINPDTVWYLDADGDNYAVSSMTQCTSPGAGYTTSVLPLTDCDDGDSAINPDTVWYLDADGDNYAISTMTQCASPGAGYTNSVLPLTDCDDGDSAINPDTVWYLDADGDNYAVSTMTQCTSPGAGYTTSVLPLTDCDDSDSAINPDTVWYLDADGDNYAVSTMTQCTSPGAGYTTAVLPITDCDDSDSAINPDTVWYLDSDGDNYAVSTMTQCTSPGASYTNTVLPLTDCDDTNSAINPGQTEIEGNGLDDDCNPATPDIPLGIDEFNLEALKIFPNPFNHSITIQLPIGFENDSFDVGLFDLNGRRIYQKSISSSNRVINIDDLSVLQQGLYFIKITDKEENKSVVRELIKY